MTDTDLNEVVARKLGLNIYPFEPHTTEKPCVHSVPDYCGSIQAAWEIIQFVIDSHEKQINETGHSETPSFALRMGPVGRWHCDFGNSGDAGWYQPTAPMAIVKAFLKLPDKEDVRG